MNDRPPAPVYYQAHPAATPPTRADASVITGGIQARQDAGLSGLSSITTASTGKLQRRATTGKTLTTGGGT